MMIEINRENLLVLVPAFNEEQSVAEVLTAILDEGFIPLLISDGSTDKTALNGRTSGSLVIELPYNLGVGGALRAGFKYAVNNRYEAIVQIDGDGQHPADEINNLISAANMTGAHMVIGSRFLNPSSDLNVGSTRRIAMRFLSASASASTGVKITDATSGFRLIRNPLLEQFSRNFANNYLGDTYESIISAGRSNYKVVEISACLREREFGESTAKMGSAVAFTLKGLAVSMLGLHKRLNPIERD